MKLHIKKEKKPVASVYRRSIGVLGACSLLVTLGGCSMALQNHYSSVTPHTVAPLVEGSGVISVENYYELVNALLYFVSEHQETGQVRFLNYSKETVKTHMTEAVVEVLTQTALGSYGGNTIDWEVSTILGHLEAELTISYKKEQADFDNILHLNGSTAIARTLTQQLIDLNDSVVVQNAFSSTDRSQIASIISQSIAGAAQFLVEIPQVHTTFYPKEGPWRLVEFQFQYSLGESVRRSRQDSLMKRIQDCTSPLWSLKTEDMYQRLMEILWNDGEMDDVGSTAYDVLVLRKGNSRGFALAFQALCQEMDLKSYVIEGTFQGDICYWNMITLESGDTHHVDVTRGNDEGVFSYFSDEEMEALGYEWNRGTAMPASGYRSVANG